MHVVGDTGEDLAEDALRAKLAGFTAVRFSPFPPDYYLHKSYTEWADEAVRRVGMVRDAVGNDTDICVEIHRQMNPAESIWLGRRIEQFNPFFYEDPMLPDSPAKMGEVQAQCNIPIATGERFTTIFEYQQLLECGACAYVRPDLCLCGGLSGCKKVAAMAEAQHVKVIPHNPLSPVSTAACVQLDACIPNFALQEYTGRVRAAEIRPAGNAARAGIGLPNSARGTRTGHRAERIGANPVRRRAQSAKHANRLRRISPRQVTNRDAQDDAG